MALQLGTCARSFQGSCLTLMHVQVFWVIGPTALLIVTAAAMAGLFAVDFVPIPQSTDLRSLQQARG